MTHPSTASIAVAREKLYSAWKRLESFVITHRLPIDDAPQGYRTFRDHKDECIKVVLKPHEQVVH